MTAPPRGRRWLTVLRSLPLLLLAVVLWREKPWAIRLATHAPWAVAASIALNLVVILPLKAARWRVALTAPPPFRQVLAATFEGLLANAAIGFGSGDVVRAARLRADQTQLTIDYACAWAERGAPHITSAMVAPASKVPKLPGRAGITMAALMPTRVNNAMRTLGGRSKATWNSSSITSSQAQPISDSAAMAATRRGVAACSPAATARCTRGQRVSRGPSSRPAPSSAR